jgi:hypothetical protein
MVLQRSTSTKTKVFLFFGVGTKHAGPSNNALLVQLVDVRHCLRVVGQGLSLIGVSSHALEVRRSHKSPSARTSYTKICFIAPQI